MRFAEVAVDAPTGCDRTFSYSVPLSEDLHPGHLVKVPFGSRTLQGVVFRLAAHAQVPETRPITGKLTEAPVLNETQLALARWISQYYYCSLFEAAAPMLPPGGRSRFRTYLSSGHGAEGITDSTLTPLQNSVLGYIRNHGPVEQGRVIRACGQGTTSAIGRLLDKGLVLPATGRGHSPLETRYTNFLRATSAGHEALADSAGVAISRAPRQSALLRRLTEDEATLGLSEARRDFGVSAVNGLLAKGWAEKKSVVVERDPLAGKEFSISSPAVLTPQQDAVAASIRATLDDPSAGPRTILVQGVTGSGKTEVYLNAVEHCLQLGKKAIVLVPEIALTHQTIERFAGRFPGRIAVLHSGLTAGERFDQWWKTRHGEYGVVIGSRSAIFAPLSDLGLVVIDEEHEWTYKQQDASPRYHARDVAIKLAQLSGSVVVLGSASPDLGTYHKSLHKEYRLLTLADRFLVNKRGPSAQRGTLSLASVDVVDMRRELREGNRDIFSRSLAAEIEQRLGSGDQIILFLNRRGSASYIQCRDCGGSLRCKQCDISLSYHKDSGRVICHYCGRRRAPPAACPRCLGHRLSYYGVGTQAVVQEVMRRWPETTVLRSDSDATRGPRAQEEILERFRSGEAQVLVGTQMIAKGLHFPAVTLVGVVSADPGLNIPDLRAGERAFQLLCQVAGRAGRGPAAGKVIIQTFQPDNYAVQAAASQDYPRFYRREISFRREQGYPPFAKLIRLLYAHTNRAACEREALRLAEATREQQAVWGYFDIELLGPTPAYPARLRGRYRWHIVLRGQEPRRLLDKVTVPPGWVVDIDPVALT